MSVSKPTSLTETIRRVRSGGSTIESCVSAAVRLIETADKSNSFIELFSDDALEQAKAIDRRVRSGSGGKLAGCVIGLKDNICVEGRQVSCGSRILSGYVSPYSAHVVDRLRAEDAVIIGRTNMDEFAMGSSTETSCYGPVLNPHDPERVPGGSSGGSAAAVASGLVSAALGSDTGGSIRQPAAFCGVTGLKPTYGRVSRYGLVAFASSLDQIGPLCGSVSDAALMLEVIAGYDKRDSTSVDRPVPGYSKNLTQDRPPVKAAVPKEYFSDALDPAIAGVITGITDAMKRDGIVVEPVSLPHTPYTVAAYYILANAEASSNLARYDGVRYGHRTDDAEDLVDMYMKSRSEGFGEEVKRRIILGTYVLSAGYYDAYYRKAQKVRRLIYDDFQRVFADYDIVLSPVTPAPPFKLGEKTDNPLEMYLEDIFTVPVNLAGLPALVIPAGTAGSGLPVGLQIIGRHFDEETVLQAGHFIERQYCGKNT